jgi:hypothetical protein
MRKKTKLNRKKAEEKKDFAISGRNSEMFTTDVWDTYLHNIRTGIVGEYHKIEGLTQL